MSAQPPATPATIAEFEILRQLGAGGMGCVFLARHVNLGVERVVKQILREHAQSAEAVRRFFAEARAAARLQHRNVVVVYDCRTDANGQPFLVLEYLRGVSGQQFLAAHRARASAPPAPGVARTARGIAPAIVLIIVGQTANALTAAHGVGIVHRDIKPDNIMLVAVPDDVRPTLTAAGIPQDAQIHVKVLDFGIAKLLNEQGGTGTGIGIGTPQYMAPEQLEGRGVSSQADQYSCAAMAYQLLTGGAVPWGMDTPAVQIFRRQQSEPPPDPRTIEPSIPAAVAEVIQKGMACNPADRWPSVAAFARALADAIPAGDGLPSGRDLLRLFAIEIATAADAPTLHAVNVAPTPGTDVLPPALKPHAPTPALQPPRPTTLGSSVASQQVAAATRRRGVAIAGGAVAVAAVAITAVLALGGGGATATSVDAATGSVAPAASASIDAGPDDATPVDAAPTDASPAPTDAPPPTDAAPPDAARRRHVSRPDAAVYIRPI